MQYIFRLAGIFCKVEFSGCIALIYFAKLIPSKINGRCLHTLPAKLLFFFISGKSFLSVFAKPFYETLPKELGPMENLMRQHLIPFLSHRSCFFFSLMELIERKMEGVSFEWRWKDALNVGLPRAISYFGPDKH